jgi:2-polyprenyl-3-methyl-5-hydroxy-6-metoxy-1,4-benzoquinol methylase
VGHLFPGPRQDLVRLLQSRYRQSFVGRAYFDEMARTYSASRLVFNRSIKNDLNMRVFEALACGSLLLTNDLTDNGQAELFTGGVHLDTYGDAEELLDKVAYYLRHAEIRERIAAEGRREAHERHTYRLRMERLLSEVQRQARTQAGFPADVPRPSGQEPGYFEHVRPEVAALVPDEARTILEIGCGGGRLGEHLKARQPCQVTGIELSAAAAEAARGRLDQVVVGDVERMQLDFQAGQFDCVVCADVLEHLRRPDRLLRQIRSWLAPGGTLVVSLPNVRHHTVVRGLLDGNWTYEPAGLLDATHLRFFTRQSARELLEFAGFQVESLSIVPGPGHAEWVAAGRPTTVRVGGMQVSGQSQDDVEEFFAYQFLVTARPARPTRPAAAVAAAPPTGSRRGPAADREPRRGPMRFTQGFVADFEQFDFFGPPFAFVRFGDGERAICLGRPIAAQDGWSFDGGQQDLSQALLDSLRYDAPDYYVGISDSCCDPEARRWYLEQIRVPGDQVTFANIFVNWNYRRFRQLDLAGAVTVGCAGTDFLVPEDVFHTPCDIDGLVQQLLGVDRPILVAAGPLSCILIHRYWQRATRKQVIVDVGSAIDERLKGTTTRNYQRRGTRTAELVCHW